MRRSDLDDDKDDDTVAITAKARDYERKISGLMREVGGLRNEVGVADGLVGPHRYLQTL